ncbi:MAG: SDR family NAD(P)-dependent oxidoreductase, partial [Alistipes putredinis]
MTRKGTIEKGSRTALVTGAGSGIGRCMARRLAELGYRLILAGLDPAKLEAAAEELHEQYGLAVEVIPIDLARPEAAHELFERVQALGREVDVLVNNAGAFSFRDILQTPVERILKIFYHAVTFADAIGCSAPKCPAGAVEDISSTWPPIRSGCPGRDWRCTAPANPTCVVSVAFAREVREQNIRVTAVCPAGVATDLYPDCRPLAWRVRVCSSHRTVVPGGAIKPLAKALAAPNGGPASLPSHRCRCALM